MNGRRPTDITAHPWAWWAWALGCAGAASLSANPLLNALITLVVLSVVVLRRTDEPWARSIGAYLGLAVLVLGIRMFFAVVAGASVGETILFTLPQATLPDWAAGIRLGGPVTAEALAYVGYDSLRLGAMLLCLGAANSLANPRRALKAVPAALYEASVAVVIALSVAPQLIESTARIRRARRLRGGPSTGWSAVNAVVVPVIADAVDRSIRLAAGMEARGFGRTGGGTSLVRGNKGLLLAASGAAILGGFGVLAADALPSRLLAGALLVVGVAGVVLGLRRSGRRLAVTRYRPDPWTPRDTALLLAGGLATIVTAVIGSTALPETFAVLHPSTDPLVWPMLHPAMLGILICVAAPLTVTRPPRTLP